MEFRAVYHLKSDDFLTQVLQVDGRTVPVSIPNRVNDVPIVKVIKVPPISSRWHITSELSHGDTVRRRRPAVIRETSSCPPGFVGCGAPRVQEQDQWATELVVDARCEAEVLHHAKAGQAYLLQYDFYGPNKCTLRMVEQAD